MYCSHWNDSEESDYDSEDIPLGAKMWDGKDGGGGSSSGSSGSDSDSDEDEDGAEVAESQGETKEYEPQEGYGQQEEYGQQDGGYDSGYAAETGGGEEGWEQVYDEESGGYYWYNSESGETKWE